ncbi:ATP-dependent DNA helicase PIF1 [Paramuricea clavata]|uniref:ATP-dependent DNA helicase PIF1 n=1 Tax=Paramuricea clavata TaxID=317549 RepID=A0A6S7I6K1_PARCT|nr:ATP-dependent DNA helicase PIF1 [Paramuricea clavata]
MAEAQAEMEEEDFDLILSLDDTDAEKDDKTSPVIRQSTDAFTINEVIAVLERISSSTIKSEAEIATTILRNTRGEKGSILLCYLEGLMCPVACSETSIDAAMNSLLSHQVVPLVRLDNDEVAKYNYEHLVKLNTPIAEIHARHSSDDAKRVSSQDMLGLHPFILISKGAKVMLTMNLWASVGLCNGSTGTIIDIIYAENHAPPDLPIAVLVKFDNYCGPSFASIPSIVPIPPVTATVNVQDSIHERHQLPLTLAWALSIHKSQGMTLEKAWIDIGKTETTLGMTWTNMDEIGDETAKMEITTSKEGELKTKNKSLIAYLHNLSPKSTKIFWPKTTRAQFDLCCGRTISSGNPYLAGNYIKRNLSKPQFSPFFGFSDGDKNKGVAYNVWRFEVESVIKGAFYPDEVILEQIRRSLQGEAKAKIVGFGSETSCESILGKLNQFYSDVGAATGDKLLAEAYQMKQGENEEVAAFASRLDSCLRWAKRRGTEILPDDESVERQLRMLFWGGIKESIKDKARHKKDNCKTFAELITAARYGEKELGSNHSGWPTEVPTCYRCGQAGHIQIGCRNPPLRRRETNEDLCQEVLSANINAPHLEKSAYVLKELIGDATEAVAFINGHACLALLDTGSQVTSIAKSFYDRHLFNQPIEPIQNIVRVVGAGGQEVPFRGYVTIHVSFPETDVGIRGTLTTLALVVPNNSYNQRVPVIIGTNLVKQCRNACQQIAGQNFLQTAKVSSAWKRVYQFVQSQDRFLQRQDSFGAKSYNFPITKLQKCSTI